ncbi:hypothetical protein PT156_07995 [Erysipelothrix rhusiopathiae]|nr:hypothetical protein [Erysipelothrix rhusiopathiae]
MATAIIRFTNGSSKKIGNITSVVTYNPNAGKVTHDINDYIANDVLTPIHAIMSDNFKYVIYNNELLLDIQFFSQ